MSKLQDLKVLQLGGLQSYRYLPKDDDEPVAPGFVDEWGTTVRWMTFVNKRTERYEKQRMENMKADKPDGTTKILQSLKTT